MKRARPLFVVNPAAGNGRASMVIERARGWFPGPAEIVVSASPRDAEEQALRGALEGFSPVVAVGDTQLLLATGPGGTRTLHTLEQPLPMPANTPSPFAQVLAQQFGKKRP